MSEKPVGPLLQQLASQWRLELAVDEEALAAAGISLDRRISFHVREATADELLRAIADRSGLSVSRRGGRIEVGVGAAGAERRRAWPRARCAAASRCARRAARASKGSAGKSRGAASSFSATNPEGEAGRARRRMPNI